MKRIAFVVGPGRSGTSTLAGTLARLGFEVPGKAIGANPSNPMGFYEPRWMVDLHKELLKESKVSTLDSSPDAIDVARKISGTPAVRATMRDWLAECLKTQSSLVIKDPRLIWFTEAWAETAVELGVSPTYLVMLRHPSAITRSRSTFYKKNQEPPTRYDRISHVTGWLNVALLTEQITRSGDRVFIEYPELLADWRTQLTRADETLGLDLREAMSVDPHPVDEFITPSLRRAESGWDGIDLPDHYLRLGDQTYDALVSLTHQDADEAAALAQLKAVSEEYSQLVEEARALLRWATRRANRAGFREGLRKGRAQRPPATPWHAPVSSRLRRLSDKARRQA